MANWDKILSRGNVEDRRGVGPVTVGGLGMTGIAVLLLFNLLTGGDLGDVLSTLEYLPVEQRSPQQNIQGEQFAGEDSYEVFASKVLGSNNEHWKKNFNQNSLNYNPPKLVLFRAATNSDCGVATSQVGPHYCSLDRTIYLDETFFDELRNRFGAEGGDVAEAYVIAHEVGHHIQNELGIMERVNNQSLRGNRNELSVRLELQADCFAGLWANSIKDQGILEPNEIREAMDAAASVGDDRIQEKVTGRIDPESWTHGSSDERVAWFTKGFETGSLDACDTSM